MKLTKLAACVAAASLLAACGSDSKSSSTPTPKPPAGPQFVTAEKGSIKVEVADVKKVLENNADIALAAYSDAVITAEALKTALAAFKAEATKATPDASKAAQLLEAAKKAWLISREPYGQTEVYRFRSSPIDDNHKTADADDGPEGSLNAWPLGEGLIDYVKLGSANAYGDFNTAQIGVTGNSAKVQSQNKVKLEVEQEDGSKKMEIGRAHV